MNRSLTLLLVTGVLGCTRGPAGQQAKPTTPPSDPILRVLFELDRADQGLGAEVGAWAAVPILCGDSKGWLQSRDACLDRLITSKLPLTLIDREGRAVQALPSRLPIYDRGYAGLMLQERPPDTVAMATMNVPSAALTSACNHTREAPLPTLDAAFWDELDAVTNIPDVERLRSRYPAEGRPRANVVTGDLDGDGHQDRLVSLRIARNVAHVTWVEYGRDSGEALHDRRLLSWEWSTGEDSGWMLGPVAGFVDVRSMQCFELDGKPGLEFIASVRGETEREQLVGSFAGRLPKLVGYAMSYGD